MVERDFKAMNMGTNIKSISEMHKSIIDVQEPMAGSSTQNSRKPPATNVPSIGEVAC